MPVIPCGQKINCDCPELPLENLSSEDPDSQIFCSTVTFTADPPLGVCVNEVTCTDFCCSDESQEDAYFCALRRAEECVWETWHEQPCPPTGCPPDCPPDCPPFCPPTCPPYCPPGPPPVSIFFNTPQTCTKTCPDGSSFSFLEPAGKIEALTQAEADFLAHAVACKLAQQKKICFNTPAQLPSACFSDAETYYKPLSASGGTPITVTFDIWQSLPQECLDAGFVPGDVFPYYWTIISGSLPNGIKLGTCDGILAGTPTESGDFTFTVKITDAVGSFQTKTFHLSIIDFSDSSPLPNGTVGTAYSNTLALTGGVLPIKWSIESGALPDGLSLDPDTGKISGTPTTAQISTFTVLIEDASP